MAVSLVPRLLLAMSFLVAVTGCGQLADDGATDETADPEPDLVLMAKLPPIASLVEAVVGDRGEVHSLVPQGADAHTHEPRPSDVRRAGDAAAFFGVGLGLNNTALQLAEENLPVDAPVIRLAEEALDDDAYLDDHVGDHEHDDGHGHTHDGAPNPHVWVDPDNAAAMTEVIRDELVAVDPGGEDAYRANAERQLEDIAAFDAAVTEAVQTIPPEHRTLVVYHDAWAYFGARYDLEVVAGVQPADFSEPSAADVRAIIDQIEAADVPAVFGAAEFPSDVLDAIVAETGAAYGTALADDELPGEPGDPEHSYLGMMQRNAVAIVDGLGGDSGPVQRVTVGG